MTIYLDNNATTALDERVLEAMLPYLSGPPANPSSIHQYGRLARAAIDQAREQVASLVGAHHTQILFTSGGTEANNLAIKGAAMSRRAGRVLYGATEHHAVMDPCQALGHLGWQTGVLQVDNQGFICQSKLTKQLSGDEEKIVSVMWANNETGVIQDIPAIAEQVRSRLAIVHTDAVQAAGKIPVDFANSGANLMTLSAHKIYGPHGAGALIHDKTIELFPQLHGGGQERGLRGGTEDVAAIVGFGVAAELAQQAISERAAKTQLLRDDLESRLEKLPGVVVFAQSAKRLPNTLQFAVSGFDSAAILMHLDKSGIAVSSGSACTADSDEPSHVLQAMGVEEMLARGAVRVSFGAVRVSFGQANQPSDVTALVTALGGLLSQFSACMPDMDSA